MKKLKRAFTEGLKRFYLLYIACFIVFTFFNYLNSSDLLLSFGRGVAQAVTVYILTSFVLFLRMNRFR